MEVWLTYSTVRDVSTQDVIRTEFLPLFGMS